MQDLLIIARTVHFVSAIGLAGLFAFVAFITLPPPLLRQSLLRLGWISLAIALLGVPLRLVAVAQSMSADTLWATIAQGVPELVLTNTRFGHALLLQLVLDVTLIYFIARLGQRRARDLCGTVIAASALAASAWQGHADANLGANGVIHLTADVLHLIAAGLWLGALLPLAMLLRDPGNKQCRREAAERFSTLGVACVLVLLVSGIVNAWYLVGSIPGLIGTAYGRVLLVKLALVALLLVLASFNRWRLMPRLANLAEDLAPQRLARHAVTEAVIGLGVIGIVAMLGTMVPAEHEQPLWPFGVRFGLDMVEALPQLRDDLNFSGIAALLGLAALVVGIWGRRLFVSVVGLALGLGLGVRAIELLLVPTTPTTYQISPEPFNVATIAQGHVLFDQNCVACHGSKGRGDGPLGASLPIAPADLTAHLTAHTQGDLYSFIGDGMDGGVMPSFAALSSLQRWDLVVFLQAQEQATVSTLTADVTTQPAPTAPDFSLLAPQEGAASLAALRARGGVLLVFATFPQSQERLEQLQGWRSALSAAGITVVDLTDAPDIRDVYSLYQPSLTTAPAAPAAPDSEFLIDEDGYLRARWQPGDTPDWSRLPVLENEIAAMARLQLAPVVPAAHVHPG